jgi:acyl dehydratase
MSRFDEFDIGWQWQSSRRTIGADAVSAFASLTGDNSPLHLDDAAAAAGPYGRRIAHGMLVLSCSIGLAVEGGVLGSDLIAFAGVDRLRFVAPVFIGDAIAVRKRTVDRQPVDDSRGTVTFDTRVVNQDDVVVAAYVDRYLLRR